MNNVINESKSMMDIQKEKAQATIQVYKNTPEYAEDAKNYNNSLTTLDPTYSGIKPLNKIIVRCFLNEPVVLSSGLTLPYKEMLSYKTQSGQYKAGEFETDWPYKDKAVVVAVPEGTTVVQPGDIIQLYPTAVDVRVIGQGNNIKPVVANYFVQVDSVNVKNAPTKISDPDYGYVLITLGDIIAKY